LSSKKEVKMIKNNKTRLLIEIMKMINSLKGEDEEEDEVEVEVEEEEEGEDDQISMMRIKNIRINIKFSEMMKKMSMFINMKLLIKS